ncbi:MAG TPA: TetR/AcrR family transcriptional regulator [Vicinamibacteria bacterium]|nr:TetR/AcrR family transcriptional regulator [Vicinamibacteria bacterium]
MPTPLRKPTAERRREIGEAALRIAGLRGVTALTTANLAEEVGVTTGALFRHFPTLDDVLREAVRLGLEKMAATFPDAGLPPLERIGALARNRVAVLSRDPGLAWLVRSDQAALMLPEDAVSALLEFVGRSRRFLLEALREGAAEGSIRRDIDPEALLVAVVGTIHALVGMPGIHRLARGTRKVEPERVLSGLMTMLAPSGRARRRIKIVHKEKK